MESVNDQAVVAIRGEYTEDLPDIRRVSVEAGGYR